ncbi:MAG TPA: glycosyltransferase family 87 protein [Candidatus Binatia bacterium]|nr:glycosyltransferase family 87 protein [Candidatus Binatia bacterium]
MQRDSLDSTVKAERFSHFAGALGLGLVIFFAAVFLLFRPYSVPGPMMRDFEAYYAAGATWAAGGDPYSTQIWTVEKTIPGVDAARTEVLPFLGPPISLPFWAILARFPFEIAAKLWGAILGVAVLVIFLGSFTLAGRKIRWSDAPIIVALAAAFSPLSYGFSLGQSALVAIAMVIAALWLLRDGRWPWSALASFGALVLKPNVSFALLGLLRSRRGFVSLAAACGAFVVTNLIVAGGPDEIGRYARALRGHTSAERFSFLQITPASILFGFGIPAPAAAALGVVCALIAVAVLAIVVYRTRARELESAALACAVLPLVSPFLHVHDLIVVFLPAMLCLHRARGWAWVAGAIGTVIVATDWVAMTQGKIGGVYDFLVALIVGLEIVALAPAVPLRLRLAPFVVALCILPIWAAAPSQAVGLWPDGLPRGFTVSLNQPVSAVWEAEQVAAGLERVDPFAAFVRSLSLAGSVLVWGSLAATLAGYPRTAPLRDGVPTSVPSDVTAQLRPKGRERKTRVATQVDG